MKTHVTINGKEIDRITEVNKDWIAETLNGLLLALDGLTFEKKEEQKPFSVDNPPKEEEHYFYVGGEYELKVCNVLWFKEDGTDISNLTQGNCFRTKEEAEAALSRVLQALKS